MEFEIRWTPRAKRNLISIKEYLTEEWSESVAKGFNARVKDFTEVITEFPNLGKIEVESKGIHGF